MKVLRELKSKKILKSVLKGSLKTNVFLILLGIFFSTLAFAAALTVTWEAAIIPGGNNNFNQSGNPNTPFSCKSSQTGAALNLDRTEEPSDIAFSDDGLTVFTTNKRTVNNMFSLTFSQNRLSRPFDISSDKVKTDPTANCDDLDGLNINSLSNGGLNTLLEDIDFAKDGKIFFIMATAGQLAKFNAVKPFDVDGLTYSGNKIVFAGTVDSTEFSRDGTKLFTLDSTKNAPVLETYSVPGDYDIASATEIQSINLEDYGVIDTAGEDEHAQDFEFNSNGSALFVLIRNSTNSSNSWIYQFSLSKNYDVSTATKVGRFSLTNIFLKRNGNQSGLPYGFGFSKDGMKLFILDIMDGNNAPDHINQFQLECPFGVVACVSDSTAAIGSQVELAKQNINLNISSIFYRFEWIKRNRDKENFTSHNININYPNPLLESLAKSFEPATKKKIATLVSTSKKDQKKSKWSSWSLGDLSLSNFDKLGFENEKHIRAEGITFGADRKFSDNNFFGWAIRYGDSKSNIYNTKQNIHMDSLTLNLYGIMPRDKERYINAVLGLSALKIDSLYLGKKSGQRYGKQLFTSINFRTKNSFKIPEDYILSGFNLTPSGKITFGITSLGEYTDFLSEVTDSPTQNIRYENDTFTNGEFSGGFLFESDQVTIDDKTFQPMGGIEVIHDFTDDIDYNYSLLGSSDVNTDTILGAYSKSSLKISLGFELIYPNGLTLSPMYEKTSSIKGTHLNSGITERFIIKLSRSKEMDGNNFALDFDPLNQNYANISFNKNLGNLNLKLNSNYSLFSKIPDYGANLEISGTF